MCTNVIGIETCITRRRVFAKLDHKFERRDPFRAVDGRFAGCIEHLAAERPEDRHEVGDGGVSLRSTHDITVSLRACRFFLLDGFSGREHIVPGRRRVERILLKKIFAIKK